MKSVFAFAVPAMTLLLLLSAGSLALSAHGLEDQADAARGALAKQAIAERAAADALQAVRPLQLASAGAGAAESLAALPPYESGVPRTGAAEPLAALPPYGTGVPLAGAAGARPITAALSGEIDAIGRIAREQSVEIERIATTGSHPQGYAAASALTQEVPMTGGKLLAVRLSVNGTYGHYPEFKEYLARLAQRGALQSIQLRANRFELTTEIYGVPDGV